MALRGVGQRIAVVDTRRIKTAPKTADPFYLSPEWRAFITAVIDERSPGLMALQGHLCEDPQCGAQHTATMRIFGDHVVELRDGGKPFDRANIMLRCGSSHTAKTLRERARRLGQQPEGGGSKV